MSSISAWARLSCAATSCRATGFINPIDAGKTWKHVGLGDTQAISRIRVDPSNPDIVYVSALGHPYGSNAERGVFRSRDGGKTWQKILYKDDHAGAVDLVLDPHNSRVIYAAIWDVYRTSWTLSSGGPRSGLYKSTDGGDHWTEITRNAGLPQGIIGKIGVAVSADSNRVYAMVEAEDGGLFRSEDAGANWTRINEDRRLRQRAFYYSRITADPKDKDVVYIMNTGLYKSTDGGKTVKQLRPRHGDQHDLWIASNDPQRMINSNDGGANVSVNGGETWTGEDYPTAQLYHVATTIDVPYHVCGAQQDNTTICVTSATAGTRRRRSGMEYMGRPVYSPGGGESGYIAPDPKNADIFYAGSQGALLTDYDRKTGQMRDVQVYPLFFSGMSASVLKERWQWTFPIVFTPSIRIFSTPRRSICGRPPIEGQSWEMISPDLTRADPKTLGDSGGPITKDQNGPEIYATIFTIAPSPHGRATRSGPAPTTAWFTSPRRRQELEKRHPQRPARFHPHQPDRRFAAQTGHGLCGGEKLSGRRSPAVRLSHRRLRRHLDQDRQRDRARRLCAGRSRRSQARRPAVRRNRAWHLCFVR